MDAGENAARLERIQGGINLIAERQEHANRIADERHEGIKMELTDIRRVQHSHGNEIASLKTAEHVRQGERKGLAATAEWIKFATGGGVVAIAAAILRYLGV